MRNDKLGAILLYEANFNQNNKKLGRDMMYTAEQLQVVAKERYGSRKNKAAIEQCLNKRLTFDLTRQLKRPLAMCSNDAKSCYDRIVHSAASPQHATYGCGRTADSVYVYHDPKPASFYPYRVRRCRTPDATSFRLIGRRYSSYRQRNCPGEVSLVPYRFKKW